MNRKLLLIARVGVAALLIVWLFRRSGGLAPVWNAFRSARPALVVAAFLATLAVQALIAHRLQRLTAAGGATLGTREVLAINLTTLFYGLFLPGGGVTAIAIRYFRLTRGDRRYAATLVAIVCDRVLATAALCVTGLGFWLFDPGASRAGLAVLLVAAAASFATLAPMFGAAPARRLGAIAARIPFARDLWPRVDEALAMCRALPSRGRLEVGTLSAVAHVLGAAVYLLLARSLAIATPFAALGWMRALSGLVTLVPISVSGLGLREGTMTALLAARGVPHAAAFAYSLLVFGITVLATGLIGGLIEASQWFGARAEPDPRPGA
ncbi:MAG: flippase-like domain-containing protein [Candidatus Eisenbacteria bacterium]|nr:flippase-like domain-containing protein [Candidatus Eisenbacteria bacterium]